MRNVDSLWLLVRKNRFGDGSADLLRVVDSLRALASTIASSGGWKDPTIFRNDVLWRESFVE